MSTRELSLGKVEKKKHFTLYGLQYHLINRLNLEFNHNNNTIQSLPHSASSFENQPVNAV
jgi:hypothetical protein